LSLPLPVHGESDALSKVTFVPVILGPKVFTPFVTIGPSISPITTNAKIPTSASKMNNFTKSLIMI